MEVRASISYVSISPQKLRLVCDKVRGVNAPEALALLKFIPNKGAAFISKALASAMANAENNHDLDPTEMYVRTIFADGGPMLKRFKAGARGRYKPRVHRTSHLTVVIAEREGNLANGA